MGLLVDGVWHDKWYDTKSSNGKFVRSASQFRNQITPDGEFKPESGRYHLYVSLACPWAHRALIFRKLKQLEHHISVSVVDPIMLENGWEFSQDHPDPLYHFDFAHQVYTKANPSYSGRVTVPILWDKKTQTIVNNESAEIIRIFNSAFNDLTGHKQDFYPDSLQPAINEINDFVYDKINNGVYKSGFSTTESAYKDAVIELFSALDVLETKLSKQAYLVGEQLTEADWRLFTTLIRFDAVYVGHFKCNLRRIQDYPNIQNYMKALYQDFDIADTVNMEHIKRHYYVSHTMINPNQVVPAGPVLDLDSPHNR